MQRGRYQDMCERLLLVTHARACLDAYCSMPRCGRMKALDAHMDAYSSLACDVPGCFDTQYTLYHYRHCSDVACKDCAPARAAGLHNHHCQLSLTKQDCGGVDARTYE